MGYPHGHRKTTTLDRCSLAQATAEVEPCKTAEVTDDFRDVECTMPVMAISHLDSLTPGEKAVLAALLEQRDQKAVARSLGLSPETVKTHLRNAREKCGADTSFALAKALALHDGAPPRWGITAQGGGDPNPVQGIDAASMATEASGKSGNELRDVRTPFVFDQLLVPDTSTSHAGGSAERRTISRLLTIAVIALLLVILIILAFPLSESFQRMANLIDPPNS